jgi:putative endonuclease
MPIAQARHAGRQWWAMAWRRQIEVRGLERTLAALDWLAARLGKTPAQPEHLLTGIEGEEAAYFHLCRKGYHVVARRWSAGNLPGDLDLVAWQGSLLCVIEVKSRTTRDFLPAETAVDGHKRRVLRRLARRYLLQLPGETRPQVRFDIMSVYLEPGQPREIVHFEAAFGWSEWRGN